MNDNTNSAHERTASIDLAQLDTITKRLYDSLPASPNDAPDDSRELWYIHEDLRQLARRSLTSGTPAEPVAEVIEEPAFPGSGIMVRGVRFIDSTAKPGDKLYRAAPVHDATAPSDLTTVPCPSCDGKSACDDCTGQGRIIVSAKDMAELSAGAAAKTEQAWVIGGQRWSKEDEMMESWAATAAGAGSAQPEALDERAQSWLVALPPLPEPWGTMYSDALQERDGYTADQLRGYALDHAQQIMANAPSRDAGQEEASTQTVPSTDAAVINYGTPVDKSDGAAGTVEKDAAPLAHGHRQDYYLLANARRVGLLPIHQVVRMPNWVLASELFATGSTSAHKICVDAGIDPYAIKVERAAIEAHNKAGKEQG